MKELGPDMIATHQGDVRVFEGHAFIVEAAVSVGGRDIKQGGANRGPGKGRVCVFVRIWRWVEEGVDVEWSAYGRESGFQ